MTMPATMARRHHPSDVVPAARIGVVGAGPLARKLHEAAIPLDIEVRVLTDDPTAPAVRAGAVPVLGSADDAHDLRALAGGCDVVTFDHDLIDPGALTELARTACVHPDPLVARLAPDKLLQRFRLVEAGFPGPAFASLHAARAIDAFAAREGWPVVLRAPSRAPGERTWTVGSTDEAHAVWHETRADGAELLAEAFVDPARRLSAVVARSSTGQVAAYPLLETVARADGSREVAACDDDALADRATTMATTIAAAFGVVGVMSVECSITAGGEVVVDDLVLRPHDHGHLTAERCSTTPFEQHLLAILGWPLGSTRTVAQAAAMVDALRQGAR